jgi:hypothetical protein
VDTKPFLEGPGVIPPQGATSAPQVIEQGPDKEIDQMALFDEAAERQDVVHGESIHDAHFDPVSHEEAPASIPPSSNDQLATSLTLAEAKLTFRLEPNMTLSQDPDGKLVIQELDSPVTRREKAMRRKRARSQLTEAVTVSSTLDCSDLSSLSELSEDDDGNVHVRSKMDKTKSSAIEPGQVVLEDGKMLEGGTLGMTFISLPP